MLGNIDEEYTEEARRILTLLCCSRRPLTVQELCDAVAIDLASGTGATFDRRSRLDGSDDLHEICPGLIDVFLGAQESASMKATEIEDLVPTVRIAHFSVQEYLESSRISQHKAAHFGLQRDRAHAETAKSCLVYLLEPDLHSGQLSETILEDFPFARFAAESWFYHVQQCESRDSQLEDCMVQLFETPTAFSAWVQMHDVDVIGWSKIGRKPEASPLYYAALMGLLPVAERLVNKANVSAGGGFYRNALQAAAAKGHEKLSRLLIENGADLNAGGDYRMASGYRRWRGGPLHAAVAGGHAKVVQLLIEHGAALEEVTEGSWSFSFPENDVNIDKEITATPLILAAQGVSRETLLLLLEHGANINCRMREREIDRSDDRVYEDGNDKITYTPLLSVVVTSGNLSFVRELLKRGVNIEARIVKIRCPGWTDEYGWDDEYYEATGVLAQIGKITRTMTVLYEAVSRGQIEAVRELLSFGADVNAYREEYDDLDADREEYDDGKSNAAGHRGQTPLYEAVRLGNSEMVKLLLDKGAEVDKLLLTFANIDGDDDMIKLLNSESSAQGVAKG